MRKQIIALLLTFLSLNAGSQNFSHINLTAGYHMYDFQQSGENTRLNYGPRLGAGISYFIVPSSYSRLEYNAMFFQEKYNIRYVTGPDFDGPTYGFRNTVLQNQFLFIVTGGLNWINFKLGLDWDVVLDRENTGRAENVENVEVIYSGNDEKFIDHYFSFHLAMMVNFRQRYSFGVNTYIGFTDWYQAGTPLYEPETYSFTGNGVKRSMWSVTLSYWLFKDPEE